MKRQTEHGDDALRLDGGELLPQWHQEGKPARHARFFCMSD